MITTRSTHLLRLKRFLLTAFVIGVTAVSLLLAHASTAPNVVEVGYSAELSAWHDSGVIAVPDGDTSSGQVATGESEAGGLLPIGIAVCVSVGLACGLAILVVLYRLLKQLSWPRVDQLVWFAPPALFAHAPRSPVTLTSLCIRQV